jgi:hypothetical protein
MHGIGKSDSPIVPGKPPNKGAGAPASAEGVEERGLAKGKTRQFPRSRTQSRGTLKRKLWRIRQDAKDRKGERFTALWHHIYSPDRLHEAYYQLRQESAPGVDGVTWKQYGEQLWGNLTDLAGRLARGAKVNWVLDADIRGFFDAIDHEWLLRFLQHRISDPTEDHPIPTRISACASPPEAGAQCASSRMLGSVRGPPGNGRSYRDESAGENRQSAGGASPLRRKE